MDTRLLEEVIEVDPHLYLDEILYILWGLGQGYWSASYLWEKLTIDIEYSLQIAADKSYSVDLKERIQFIQASKDCVTIVVDGYFSLESKHLYWSRSHSKRQHLRAYVVSYFLSRMVTFQKCHCKSFDTVSIQ